MKTISIDIQGHRGARGLMPENTIPAFIKALELGITTLELDLAVTKDGQLLVSHEPFMNHVFVLDSMGRDIPKVEETKHNIYEMTYAQVEKYDVGSKFHKHFPDQQKMVVAKPLLIDVVNAVNDYAAKHDIKDIRYNIEVKSLPVGDDKFHPTPQVFSDLVYDFINKHMNKNLLNVQSFDFRVLQYFHQNYPDIELAVLVENTLPIEENLQELGFHPQKYSCYYPLLNEEKVKYLHSLNMKVIPWTVNETADMEKMISWGVDGIISDYPNRVIDIFEN
ncbi:glycerophosphodiester phosphodiesterase family protein [Reichenbachiella agarivorans]|uniref:Glycerophosphodiester phosphodiesterase family protein n=1 Tax=Reichenbachiella agarivorans TaxID=2979464 RepID=A0ABY6CSU7_9BACT|nr:glycerophosphodiester phosphodiesterase family protein [Reichenbachiella agarivorans]UXP33409.1 glycerophosphodiester phosphodiesterase family protein [Reichenbachiella agarivorans]